MSGRPSRGGPYYFRLEKSVMANANSTPLMKHATAAWLVDNTGLNFVQIADYCGIHILEVQAIADETAATKYTGSDPVRSEEHTSEIQSLMRKSYAVCSEKQDTLN